MKKQIFKLSPWFVSIGLSITLTWQLLEMLKWQWRETYVPNHPALHSKGGSVMESTKIINESNVFYLIQAVPMHLKTMKIYQTIESMLLWIVLFKTRVIKHSSEKGSVVVSKLLIHLLELCIQMDIAFRVLRPGSGLNIKTRYRDSHYKNKVIVKLRGIFMMIQRNIS